MKSTLLKFVLLPALTLPGCMTFHSRITDSAKFLEPILKQIYRFEKIKEKADIEIRCDPSRETMANVMAAVWHSGSVVKSERLAKEMLNNVYGSYEEKHKICGNGAACFIKNAMVISYTKTLDAIMIGENSFCSADLTKNVTSKEEIRRIRNKQLIKFSQLEEKFLHEAFHDVWCNILSDKQKQEFSIEVKKIYGMITKAETKEARLNFLDYIGLEGFEEFYFGDYARIQNRERSYSEKKFFRTELYSIFAEEAYGGRIWIPKQLKKFYSGWLSETLILD